MQPFFERDDCRREMVRDLVRGLGEWSTGKILKPLMRGFWSRMWMSQAMFVNRFNHWM